MPDDRRALGEVYRILKPGGAVMVFAPNRRYPFETHGAIINRLSIRLPHYVPFVPYVPLALSRRVLRFWARNYWPGELRARIRHAGFSIRHLDYVWQTFEGISRNQPRLIALLSPILRRTARLFERLPLVRSLGASQVIVATKEESLAAVTGGKTGNAPAGCRLTAHRRMLMRCGVICHDERKVLLPWRSPASIACRMPPTSTR